MSTNLLPYQQYFKTGFLLLYLLENTELKGNVNVYKFTTLSAMLQNSES